MQHAVLAMLLHIFSHGNNWRLIALEFPGCKANNKHCRVRILITYLPETP